jgi:hypothetical protein
MPSPVGVSLPVANYGWGGKQMKGRSIELTTTRLVAVARPAVAPASGGKTVVARPPRLKLR